MKELFTVDSHSVLGEMVNHERILQGSRLSDMLPLREVDIQEHESGLYITEGIGNGVVAVGYVACKQFIEGCKSIHPSDGGLPEDKEGIFALIGGLYVDPGMYGRNLGSYLVQAITNQTFSNNPDVVACVAICNTRSYRSFKTMDYQPMTRGQSLLEVCDGKVAVIADRERWSWRQGYLTMYNKG